MTPVDFRALNFLSKAQSCWSCFWRGLVIGLGSGITGGVLGGTLGAVFALVGYASLPRDAGRTVVVYSGAIIGIATGLVFLYIYVRWLLGSRMGRYRLVLVAAHDHLGGDVKADVLSGS